MANHIAITSESTQLQIADFIKSELDNKVLYSPGFGWCFYDGKVWVTGKHGELMAKAEVQTIIRNYGKEHGRVKSRETAASINSIMDLLKANVRSVESAFNADPCILNTPGGIVDLSQGKIIDDNHPNYLCTCMTSCAPGEEGKEEFAAFLNQITNGDNELKSFLQVVFGMALVGKVYEEAIIIFVGAGGNGKSTINNALKEVLGTYSGMIDSNILLASQRQQKVGPELATLVGKRFVIAAETGEDVRLNE